MAACRERKSSHEGEGTPANPLEKKREDKIWVESSSCLHLKFLYFLNHGLFVLMLPF
jgi:hypothetical protein